MRIAIIGCGQLSRMLALAGLPMDIKFSFIRDDINQTIDCVEGLGVIKDAPSKDVNTNSYDPKEILQLFEDLGKPDCVTVEKEQIDLELFKALSVHCAVHPSIAAVKACQHRGEEKQLLADLAIPTSPYVYNLPAVEAIETLGCPAMVKSCTEGYDGKNQWLIKSLADAQAFDELNQQDYIIEAFVAFDKEISLVSARDQKGNINHYSLTDNEHEKGILKRSIAPAINISTQMEQQAQRYMESLLNKLDYVGVMAMECFVTGDQLMINELAPRVHNSGHWTQLGSLTCQFENHIRALAGLCLGKTQQISATGMFNLIGVEKPVLSSIAENAKLHWYNKTVKPNRKLGHVNFIAEDRDEIRLQMSQFSGS